MPCYHPLTGYRDPEGKITFKRGASSEINPCSVACGQCVGCRLERSRQWAVRCIHEAQMHDQNSFITLTYDQKHLPNDRSLNVEHWQKFARRLRKDLRKSNHRMRFFHCGEYGDMWGRPHYHAILFGWDFSRDRILTKVVRGNKLYRSEQLERLWPYGYSLIGAVTFESAAYVARYILKKVTGPGQAKHYAGKKPEYTTMSRKPGIGKKWIDKYHKEVYNEDFVVTRGHEARPPKYYDQQLEATNPTQWEEIKQKRAIHAETQKHNNTPERLKTRETIALAKIKQYSRDIETETETKYQITGQY